MVFANRMDANTYLVRLKSELQTKGYITASIDSIYLDSADARVHIYLGEQYKWATIKTNPADEDVLTAVRFPATLTGTAMNFEALSSFEERIIDYYEERGYPFGRVYLDSIALENNTVSAVLKIDKGTTYKIDSIRVYGDAKVSNEFLQRYLDLPSGSLYNKKKLNTVEKRLSELSFLQVQRPASLTMLNTGSILNLYLQPKKTSQINALIGFLPNSNQSDGNQKLQIVIDANVLLRNALGAGETIGFTWQQLQQSSPRINLLYEHPYIFHSPITLHTSFEMYRRDSTFLNINMQLGAGYSISGNQSATVFIQRRQTIVNGVNTILVLQTRRLPQEGDVSSVNFGLSYVINTTNYRFNPQRGNEFNFTGSAGTKTLKKNTQILELEDASDPTFKFESLYDTVKLNTYQLRLNLQAAHYFPLGKQSVFKTGLQAGTFQSGNVFRNELFLLGGYRTLRGFDEESQYVSSYGIGTLEYRYLIGMNSNFFVFLDGGWGKHPLEIKTSHTYLGTGLGLSFETKAGVFNLAWAIGSRDDIPFNLRQSKIHLGFASYF